MLTHIFDDLLRLYGPQGWWPVTSYKGTNPTKTGRMLGYHPGDYTFPRNEAERFEICVGAILTQGTAWANAEQAVHKLYHAHVLSANGIPQTSCATLAAAIKPSGYFNQKARKLKAFAALYHELARSTPSREALLTVWGIGKETADTIQLYAYGVPSFVVDTYTKRIFSNLALVDPEAQYDDIKAFFEAGLPRDVPLYQEYHALLVEHAKRYYQPNQDYASCPLFRTYTRP